MKTAIPALIGIILGVIAGFGYDHYLGEGKQLADAQAQLAQDQAQIAKTAADAKQAKSETEALTAQVDQLSAKRDDLQKQLDVAKTAAPAAPAQPTGFAAMFSGMGDKMKDYAARKSEAKLAALKRRLNLTPEQEAKIKAAMDAWDARTSEMTKKMFSGQLDPKKAGEEMLKEGPDGQRLQTPEQVIEDSLTADQKTAYQQMQAEEKNNAMESQLTTETNQIAPTLGLNEAQKDQVYAALGQAESQMQDPKWLQANNDPGNPVSMLDAREKAKEDALAKVLSPDQLAQWKKQSEADLALQRQMINQFMSKKAGSVPATASPANP